MQVMLQSAEISLLPVLKKEQLSSLLDSLPSIIAYIDKDETLCYANKAYLNWLNLSSEKILGKNLMQVIGNEAYQSLKPFIDLALSGKEVRFEKEIPYADGKRYISAIYTPEFDSHKKVTGYSSVINDLTEQKLKEKEFTNNEFKYHQLLQSLSVPVYTTDLEGRITFYNRAATELWGREPVLGRDQWCGSYKIFNSAGEEIPLDECPMAVAVKSGRPVFGEEIIVERPNHERMNVLPHPRPLFDSSGKLVGAINLLLDITELKYVHEALLEGEERFRHMADHAPIIIWMTDDSGNSIYWNAEWSRFTGTSLDNGLSFGWLHYIHPDDKERAFSKWEKAFSNKDVFTDKFRYRNAKNEYRIMNAHCIPRFSEENIFMGYIGILNDITLMETTNSILENLIEERTRDLIKANTELERSNHELEQFAYAASHDLQEPLRKIQTFSERIIESEKDNLSETAKDYFNRMNHAASRMQHLITDLLSFSRIRTSEKKDFEAVNLNLLLDEAKSTLNFAIEQSGATIKSQQLPVVSVIPFQFRQVFQNIISNSIKYRKPDIQPHIDISYHFVEAKKVPELRGKGKYLKLSIKDNGIGFDPQFERKIFEIFQRLHGKSEYSGTGVGLAICKKIVQNHNGHINAIGEPGKGATFNIYIPI
jgi:PAS domain S-box-containing protein